jgi:hypothetical protein
MYLPFDKLRATVKQDLPFDAVAFLKPVIFHRHPEPVEGFNYTVNCGWA